MLRRWSRRYSNTIVEELHVNDIAAKQQLALIPRDELRQIRRECNHDRLKLCSLAFMSPFSSARRAKSFSQAMFAINKLKDPVVVSQETVKLCENLSRVCEDKGIFSLSNAAVDVFARKLDRTQYATVFRALLNIGARFPDDNLKLNTIFNHLLLGTDQEMCLAIYGDTKPQENTFAKQYNLFMLHRVVAKLISMRDEVQAKRFLDMYHEALCKKIVGMSGRNRELAEIRYHTLSIKFVLSFAGISDAEKMLSSIENSNPQFIRRIYLMFLSHFRKTENLDGFSQLVERMLEDKELVDFKTKVYAAHELLLILKSLTPDLEPYRYVSYITQFHKKSEQMFVDLGIYDTVAFISQENIIPAKFDEDGLMGFLKTGLTSDSYPKSQVLGALYRLIFETRDLTFEQILQLFVKLMDVAQETQRRNLPNHTLSSKNFSGQVLNSFMSHLLVNRHMYDESVELTQKFLDYDVTVMGVFPETFASVVYWKSTTNSMEAADLYLSLLRRNIPMSHHALVGLVQNLMRDKHDLEARGFYEMLCKTSYDFSDGYMIHEALKRGWAIPDRLHDIAIPGHVMRDYMFKWKTELDIKAKLLGIDRVVVSENASKEEHDDDNDFLPDELLNETK